MDDDKTEMRQNKLKLNDDNTEALLTKSNRTIFPDSQPTSLRVDTAHIPFTTCARNLSSMILYYMTLDKHFNCLRGNLAIQLYPSYLT